MSTSAPENPSREGVHRYLGRQPLPRRSSDDEPRSLTEIHDAPRTGSSPTTLIVHRTAVLAIILATYFMIILDNSIIFTGLPSIQDTMQFSPKGLTWVQDAYGWTPLQAGLGSLPMTVVNFADALSVPRLLDRLPWVVVLGTGVETTFAGMLWLDQCTDGFERSARVLGRARRRRARAASYRDRTYEATGWYGGLPSHHDVELTLVDDVVTEVSVSTPAEDPTSLEHQQAFVAAVPGEVVGRPIDEIQIDRLAGSSGCPAGFMDALEQIKTEAAV